MNSFYGPYYSERERKPETNNYQDNTMPVEVEESSGFHVFEVHAPTAGISFFSFIVALIAIAMAYGCYRKCCAAYMSFGRQQPQQPQAIQMQPIQAPAQPDQLQPLLQIMALQALRPTAPALELPPPPRQCEPSGFLETLPREQPPRPPAPPRPGTSAGTSATTSTSPLPPKLLSALNGSTV